MAVSTSQGFTVFGLTPPGNLVMDDECLQVSKLIEDVTPDVGNTFAGAKVTVAVAAIENKKQRCMLVLRKFGWNPEEKKFRDGASEKCMELLKMLQTALMCECLLMNLVKLTAEKREPMPLVSMENLSALVCIEFSLAIADAMQTEQR